MKRKISIVVLLIMVLCANLVIAGCDSVSDKDVKQPIEQNEDKVSLDVNQEDKEEVEEEVIKRDRFNRIPLSSEEKEKHFTSHYTNLKKNLIADIDFRDAIIAETSSHFQRKLEIDGEIFVTDLGNAKYPRWYRDVTTKQLKVGFIPSIRVYKAENFDIEKHRVRKEDFFCDIYFHDVYVDFFVAEDNSLSATWADDWEENDDRSGLYWDLMINMTSYHFNYDRQNRERVDNDINLVNIDVDWDLIHYDDKAVLPMSYTGGKTHKVRYTVPGYFGEDITKIKYEKLK